MQSLSFLLWMARCSNDSKSYGYAKQVPGTFCKKGASESSLDYRASQILCMTKCSVMKDK
jgi:hypothetical protein